MVRPPYVDSNGVKKGAWSEEEDNRLRAFVQRHGHPNWRLLPLLAGLKRCGKSCRLRWVNYLKPGVKRGNFTKEEEDLIIKLHAQLGNKWSDIAKKLPGRTDNDIKNYWHAHIKKRGKTNGAVRKVLVPQTPQKEQISSEIDFCIAADDEEGPNGYVLQSLSAENPDAVNPIGDIYMVGQAQGDPWTEPYDQTCFRQLNTMDLPPFPGEEFLDFGAWENDICNFSDSSDGGITSWNSTTAESGLGNFWSEQLGDDTTSKWYFGDITTMF